MKITKFQAENELSFEIPVRDLMKLFQNKTLFIQSKQYIEQKWCIKGATEGVPYSARIRKTVFDESRIPRNPAYEYTMKYYLSPTERMEFNDSISKEEYDKLFALHPHGKVVNKTRILFVYEWVGYGNFKSIQYSADIFSGQKNAIIEIEFSSQGQKDKYVVPDWLKPYAKEND